MLYAFYDLAFEGISLPSIINELQLLCRRQIRIVRRSYQTGAAEKDSMTLANCSLRSYAADLVNTRQPVRVTMATPTGYRFRLEIFSFWARNKDKLAEPVLLPYGN